MAPTTQYDVKLDRSTFAKKRESTGGRLKHNYQLEKLQTNRIHAQHYQHLLLSGKSTAGQNVSTRPENQTKPKLSTSPYVDIKEKVEQLDSNS